ncbi:MAG: hypothetical protein K2P22_08430 [Lachnospiraceae bacterium]|nr:hypothetical protein [Lachnospiraceae bacterium]
MASNYTRNYNLCQWEASDKVLRTEFNADNAKIDAALAGKASVSSLNSLKTQLDSKADKTALDSLKSTVTSQTGTLAQKGNCAVYTITYTGDGLSGVQNPKTLTFPAKPLVVIIGGSGSLVMVQGAKSSVAPLSGVFAPNTLTWSGNSVTWYHNGSSGAAGMMNLANTTYLAIALVKADK